MSKSEDPTGRIDLLLEGLANGMVEDVEKRYGLEGLSAVTEPLIREQVQSAIPEQYRRVPRLALSLAKKALERGRG